MRKVRAKAVEGNHVLVDGKWLPCIGNHAAAPGDFVWTDGKCIYGHLSMDGVESYVPSSVRSGIPLLVERVEGRGHRSKHMYYGKKGLQDFGYGKEERRMVNRGNRCVFLPKKDATMDAELDGEGNLYTLESPQLFYDPERKRLSTREDRIACIRRNGEILRNIDLLSVMQSLAQETMDTAKEPTKPVTGSHRVSATVLEVCQATTWCGKVDEKGDFQILVEALIRASHREHAVRKEEPHTIFETGQNAYGFGNEGSSERKMWFTFDGKTMECWYSRTRTSWYPYDFSPWGVVEKGWSNEDVFFAPAGSFKLLLHDGCYATVQGLENAITILGLDTCTLHFFNETGDMLFSAPVSPCRSLMLCPVEMGKYLYGYPGKLFLWDNGEISEVVHGCMNFRLRKMPNLKKWKRGTSGDDR